jgi:hypothetical protein
MVVVRSAPQRRNLRRQDHPVVRWHSARCKSERLACEAFANFLDGEPPARWLLLKRAPTAALYQELLGE